MKNKIILILIAFIFSLNLPALGKDINTKAFVKSSIENMLIKYKITKSPIEKDKMITRAMQFYLNYSNKISLVEQKQYKSIYQDFEILRKHLFQKNWNKHNKTLDIIQLKITLL